MPTRVLFVCMGNICRSPTAEAVFAHLVNAAGRSDEFEIDSAGTGGWHAGEPADPRAIDAARTRGYRVTSIARQVQAADFDDFDVIVAMDAHNLADLTRAAPPDARPKLRMLAGVDVPDPYYGGHDGFAEVLDIVEDGCQQLLDEL